MTKVEVQTSEAPEAIGAYSQAIQCCKMVFLSGQIGLDPNTMQLVEGGFESQLSQVFKNLSCVVKATGGAMTDIVKLNVYLTDLNDYSKVNELMAEYFTTPYPARAVVEVSGLPKQALVEIDGMIMR